MDAMNTLVSKLDTGRLAACLADSACFTALATATRKAGDCWSFSRALGMKTGKGFIGTTLESSGVSDHRGLPSESGERDKVSRAAAPNRNTESNNPSKNPQRFASKSCK